MKQIIILFVILLSLNNCLFSNPSDERALIIMSGSSPTIDGKLGEKEWADAGRLSMGKNKTIYFKHDGENLYLGFSGDLGNLYFHKDNKVVIIHASFSLGWVEYESVDKTEWKLSKNFEWKLNKIHLKEKSEVVLAIYNYLKEKGWTASTIPMGNKQESEFAISFKFLGINLNNIQENAIRVSDVMLSSGKMIPKKERPFPQRKAPLSLMGWPGPHNIISASEPLTKMVWRRCGTSLIRLPQKIRRSR